MMQVDDMWLGEFMVAYYADEIDDADLIKRAGNHACSLSNVYFTLGMMSLANGDRPKAKQHFEDAVSKGSPGTFDYNLAKAYKIRMEYDAEWPPTVPPSVTIP